MPVREWDGSSYDRISGTMERLGLEVLDRLELDGDETVLDAGCGSGRITEALLERLPRGRVIAVDESESMTRAARERLGPEVEVLTQDLLELDVGEPLDAILSTATFHWIADHDRLFRRLHGTRCGRAGGSWPSAGGRATSPSSAEKSLRSCARDPYAEHFASFEPPWNYASAETTEERLRAAGFASAQLLADAGAPQSRGAPRVPGHDRPRPARPAAPRGAAGALHGRRDASSSASR